MTIVIIIPQHSSPSPPPPPASGAPRRSSPRYSGPRAHRASSCARTTGSGCVSARSWSAVNSRPTRLERASAYSSACLRNSSGETPPYSPSAGPPTPPTSFRIVDTTTAGSCATSSAARSQVSSAARCQGIISELSASDSSCPGTPPTASRPSATRLAALSHRPCSHLMCPSSWASTACTSCGVMRSMSEVCSTMNGLRPCTARVYALGLGFCFTYSCGGSLMSRIRQASTSSW
mmetsp:Transcript_17474/g.30797  ORF Transcript_17474/g.30797 Transcript_17474/m.30797 type:complete len:234 (-) Transcript_17474:408-1109(-)